MDRRMGCFTSRERALCNDGRWVKRNPVLNSARNVSFTVTHMDTTGLCLVCQDTRGMGISNNVDNSELKLPPTAQKVYMHSDRQKGTTHSLTLSSLPTLSVPLCYLTVSVSIPCQWFVIFKWFHWKNSRQKNTAWHRFFFFFFFYILKLLKPTFAVQASRIFFHKPFLVCVFCLEPAPSQALRQYFDCSNYSIWNVIITAVNKIRCDTHSWHLEMELWSCQAGIEPSREKAYLLRKHHNLQYVATRMNVWQTPAEIKTMNEASTQVCFSTLEFKLPT